MGGADGDPRPGRVHQPSPTPWRYPTPTATMTGHSGRGDRSASSTSRPASNGCAPVRPRPIRRWVLGAEPLLQRRLQATGPTERDQRPRTSDFPGRPGTAPQSASVPAQRGAGRVHRRRRRAGLMRHTPVPRFTSIHGGRYRMSSCTQATVGNPWYRGMAVWGANRGRARPPGGRRWPQVAAPDRPPASTRPPGKPAASRPERSRRDDQHPRDPSGCTIGPRQPRPRPPRSRTPDQVHPSPHPPAARAAPPTGQRGDAMTDVTWATL